MCAPGLEAVVVGELATLGVRAGRAGRGTVPFRATTRQLYAANVWLRCAERVQVRVARFPARSLAELDRRARALPWSELVAPDVPVVVRATSRASVLHHSGAVAERVAGAVSDMAPVHVGAAEATVDDGPPGDPAGALDASTGDPLGDHQRVLVRARGDEVTVSIDASGAPLHRRGWRRATAKAPLRETVAAAVLAGLGWSGRCALVDPFAGAGTIAIEAALVARRLPPSPGRRFAFERWPSFEPGAWASVQGEAEARARPTAGVPIVAADRDAGAVSAALDNAARAGVADDVEVRQASVSALGPPAGWQDRPGTVATNPPWGSRLAAGDVRDVYARLGQVCRDRLDGWSVGIVVPAGPTGLRLSGNVGEALTTAWTTTTGGTSVALVTGTVGAGGPTPRDGGRT